MTLTIDKYLCINKIAQDSLIKHMSLIKVYYMCTLAGNLHNFNQAARSIKKLNILLQISWISQVSLFNSCSQFNVHSLSQTKNILFKYLARHIDDYLNLNMLLSIHKYILTFCEIFHQCLFSQIFWSKWMRIQRKDIRRIWELF